MKTLTPLTLNPVRTQPPSRVSYVLYGPAGFDVVVEGHPLLAVRVLPRAEDILEALVVGSLIDHPHPALHPDGVAAVEVCVQVSTVAATVIAAALEFLLLKKCDLRRRREETRLQLHGQEQADIFKSTLVVLGFLLTFPIPMQCKTCSPIKVFIDKQNVQSAASL